MPTVSDDIGIDGQLTTGSLLDSMGGGFIAWRSAEILIPDYPSCRHRFRKTESVSDQGRAGREGIVMARYAAFAFL